MVVMGGGDGVEARDGRCCEYQGNHGRRLCQPNRLNVMPAASLVRCDPDISESNIFQKNSLFRRGVEYLRGFVRGPFQNCQKYPQLDA